MDIRRYLTKEDRAAINDTRNTCYWCDHICEVGELDGHLTCLKCALKMLKVKSSQQEIEAGRRE